MATDDDDDRRSMFRCTAPRLLLLLLCAVVAALAPPRAAPDAAPAAAPDPMARVDAWLAENAASEATFAARRAAYEARRATSDELGGEGDLLRYRASNPYTARYGAIGRSYPWVTASVAVVDARVPVDLKVANAVAGCAYAWRVGAVGVADHLAASRLAMAPAVHRGPAATAVVAGVGAASLEVAEACGARPLRFAVGTLFGAVVRREIREILAGDLEPLLDAMRVMWDVDGAAGRARYGPAYASIDELDEVHRQNAARRDADHFHEGMGFLAQHAKLSRRFEASLRAVDGRWALPYWDSTIEMADVAEGRIAGPFDTVLWTARMFGSIPEVGSAPSKDFLATAPGAAGSDAFYRKYAIGDGRWRHAEVPTVRGAFARAFRARTNGTGAAPTPANPYGYLRSPWNVNPSPYVSRFVDPASTLPVCESHWRFATRRPKPSEGESVAFFQVNDVQNEATWWMRNVAFLPHGRYHDATGGTVKANYGPVEARMRAAFRIGRVAFKEAGTLKTLWRYHMVDMPAKCDGAPVDCRATCTGHATREEIGRLTAALQGPRAAFFHPKTAGAPPPRRRALGARNVSADTGAAAMRAIGDALCDDGPSFVKGDQFEASGGRDPSFWPVHPAMERLFQYASLLRPFRNMSWPTANVCSTGDEPLPKRSDTVGAWRYSPRAAGVACFRAERRGPPRPEDIADCCYGHYGDSRWYEEFPVKVGGVTNARMLELLDPRRPPRPEDGYGVVYHHFRWDHCARASRGRAFVFPEVRAS